MRNIDTLYTRLVKAEGAADALVLAESFTEGELRALCDLNYEETGGRKATLVRRVCRAAGWAV
ncbi:hypothetical protein [Micromonospora maritima]|uniref:hypothetical protein n=1 Tax=Micromonospora maritima TaxID=986711 RepID=UPI00157C06FA|nr:hypothetical protein [Micromonospora maritima]